VTIGYLSALNRRYQEFAEQWTASAVVEVDTVAVDPRTEEGLEEILVCSRAAMEEAT
jgi:deoxyadenosine/deoxycytidine kinase